jgi:hypothetical protein
VKLTNVGSRSLTEGVQMSKRIQGRMLLTLLLVLGIVALTGSQAQAQPPNDDFNNAIVIVGLPFTDSQDTTSATTAPDDPDCEGNAHTVWYSFTPGTNTSITANTFGSDYDTTLSAYTGTRGSLNQIACNDDFQSLQSRIAFQATAGVTYSLMVGSFDESPGGALLLTVKELPPRVVLGVAIDPTGAVTPSGVATVHGTVTCSRDASGIRMTGTLTQRQGKRVATGTFAASIDCSGSVPWTASVVGETGTYRRGDAQARVGLNYFDPDRGEVITAGATRTVRLS